MGIKVTSLGVLKKEHMDIGNVLSHASVPLGTQATWNCAPRAETAPQICWYEWKVIDAGSHDISWSVRTAPGQPDAGKCPSNLSQNPCLRWWRMCWIYSRRSWKKIFEFAIVLLTSHSRCASHPLSHLSRIFNHPRVRGCSIAWQTTEETDCPSQGQLCAYCTDGQVMKISILLTINGDFQLMDCDGDHHKTIVTQWTGE